MKRLFLATLSLFIGTAFAGEYENALKSNDKVMLYLYSPNCGYCVRFDPVFNRIQSKYKDNCSFVKVNTNTNYGQQLTRDFAARFVPYVIIADGRKGESSLIPPSCLLHYSCMDEVMRHFTK